MHRILLAAVIGLAVCQVALVLTTVYLHRTLSHRAVRMSPALAWVCRILTWVMTGIRPRQWVAVHRKHHAYTDTEGDPHSPVLSGWAAVQFGNVWMYRKVANDDVMVARYARDVPADRWDRVFFDHAFVGLAIGIGILCLTFGWQIGLLAAAIHAVSYLLLNAGVQRRRAHVGPAALRRLGGQQPVAGLDHRRRRAAQQSPRRAYLGPPVPRTTRGRPRLVVHPRRPKAGLGDGEARGAPSGAP